MDENPFEREWKRAARHEAGPWIVGRLMGFDVGFIKRDKSQAGAELGLNRSTPDFAAVKAWCEQRVMVLFAGCLAEQLGDDGRPGNGKLGKWVQLGAG